MFKLAFSFLTHRYTQRLLSFLFKYLVAPIGRLKIKYFPSKSVLFVGQAYYNTWYLSRALRDAGWKADVLNWDLNEESQIYYHGEDYKVKFPSNLWEVLSQFGFYFKSLWKYDVFHFSNMSGVSFGAVLSYKFNQVLFENAEIYILKGLGKKIVYSNNGCMDGVSQTSFKQWGPEAPCHSICKWRNHPEVCNDAKNLAWGKFRNSVADYQCLLGGNRADYNVDARIHEVPEFYVLDKDIWSPGLIIPEKFQLNLPPDTIKLYHAVGNMELRSNSEGINIKCTHIYLPLIERLKQEGYPVALISPHNVANIDVRYLQSQADVFLDMLTYGFFGANAREAMMLGKPVICYLRPSWLESMREEIPEYVDELPVISATPETVYEVLVDLINNKEKREEIGRKSREFAIKWHSKEAGARRFDEIYSELLNLSRHD